MVQDLDRYAGQINVVVNYIHANMDKCLDVHSLARLTSFSTYHFHRIFSAVMGESLAKYVMRRRLELAAVYLREDASMPVMNIAFEVGFNSVNVFCRNFKRHFGMSAEAYRSKMRQEDSKNRPSECKDSRYGRTYSRYFCSRKSLKIGDKCMDCDFGIRRLDATYVVYCRHYGAYTGMQGAFERLMRWAYPRGLVGAAGSRLASVYHDDPHVTEEEKLISDACLIVEGPMRTDGDIGCYCLNAGQYAVGRFEISWDEFRVAWECMYRLVDEHGCRCCGLPFEVYLNNSEEHPEGKWIVDICIPVMAK